MTSLKGNLNSVDLANIFQMLSMNQREGTLYIFDGQSRKAIYFGRDGVSMLTRGRHKPDSLGRILIRSDRITPAQLQEALRLQDESAGRLLGHVLVEQGLVQRSDIEDALRTQIEEEVYSLFLWRDAQFEFVEGAPDQEFQGGEGVTRLTFSVNSLIMEAAKRVDEWEWNQKVIPSTEEIFRYSGRNVQLEDEIFQTGFAGKVLEAVDGKRSVEQIIATSYVNRFEVAKMLALLLESGAVEPLPVPELRREAQEALAAGDADAAVKFLTRLVALKGDTPDMHRHLAEVFEGRRQLEKAAFHYKVYAEILVADGAAAKAFDTCRRICELLPTDLGAADRMIEVFAQDPESMVPHAAEVVAKGKDLAELHVSLGRQTRAIQVLHRIASLAPEDQDLRNRLIQVYLQAGLPGEAISEYDALAETALAVRDYEQAERIYRKILQIDRTRDDAQAKLNQLLSRKRMRQRGIRVAVGAVVVLVLAAVGAWRAWCWVQEQKAAEVARTSAFGAELTTLRQKDAALHTELDGVVAALSAAFRDPSAMVAELKNGAPHRKDLLAKANESVRAYHSLAGRFPAVGGVEGAHDAAQTIERKTASVTSQEERLRESVRRTLEELADQLEPWPNPALGMLELERRLAVVTALAEAVPAWQSGDRGQKAIALSRNVGELLGAFETAHRESGELLAKNDVAGAQERVVDFLVRYLPPRDLLDQIHVVRTVRSRPLGAHILIDDEDTGLVTPAVVDLPVTRAATLKLVDEGFHTAAVDIAAVAQVDRTRVRETLRLSIDEVLHKQLAFRTPPMNARVSGTPAVAGERIVVPTKGIETGLFEMSGATRPALPTKGAGGVQVRPLVFDDIVVLAGYDRTLYSYNLVTGESYARENLPGAVQADPVQWHDLAIVADLDGHVTAYDVRLRSRAWTWPPAGRGRVRGFTSSPVLSDGALVLSSSDGSVAVLDPQTGAERSSGQVREGAAPVPLASGLAVAGRWYVAVSRADRTQSRLVLVDRESLQVRSSFIVDGYVRHAPLVWQGVAWVATDDAQIEGVRIVGDALESAQGLQLDEGVRLSAEPALDNGTLFVGDAQGTLWAIDVSGARPERLWDFRIPGAEKKAVPVTTRPLLTATHVLFGAADGSVYGLLR